MLLTDYKEISRLRKTLVALVVNEKKFPEIPRFSQISTSIDLKHLNQNQFRRCSLDGTLL